MYFLNKMSGIVKNYGCGDFFQDLSVNLSMTLDCGISGVNVLMCTHAPELQMHKHKTKLIVFLKMANQKISDKLTP